MQTTRLPDRLTGDHDFHFNFKIFLIRKSFEKKIDITYHCERMVFVSNFSCLALTMTDNES